MSTSSSIPGQSIVTHENTLNTQLLLISLFAGTMTYLMGLTWASFLNESIDAVQKVTNHKIPTALAKLFAAIIVTCSVVASLAAMYQWEQRVIQSAPGDEGGATIKT